MDSGMFQCLASNPAGNIQSSAFLNVFHAGKIFNLTVTHVFIEIKYKFKHFIIQ